MPILPSGILCTVSVALSTDMCSYCDLGMRTLECIHCVTLTIVHLCCNRRARETRLCEKLMSWCIGLGLMQARMMVA